MKINMICRLRGNDSGAKPIYFQLYLFLQYSRGLLECFKEDYNNICDANDLIRVSYPAVRIRREVTTEVTGGIYGRNYLCGCQSALK